jgi:hypothetical protein
MERDPEEYVIEHTVPEDARISEHIMWLVMLIFWVREQRQTGNRDMANLELTHNNVR